MKFRFFLLITSSFFTILLSAQEKLRIEYEVTPYYESEKKEDIEIVSVSSLFELISNKNESLYKNIPRISNSQIEPSGNMMATMSADINPIYKSMDSKTYVEEAQIGEKLFLIVDDLPKIDWKITKETKDIAGFPVLKATTILDDEYKTKIEAWYSPKLVYKDGPDKFWGLPGIILEVQTEINYEDGSKEGNKYLATKVEVLKSNEKIKGLDQGKEITRENFNKIQKKYLQDQMEMFDGGVDKD
ncbi:MAG TPA: GLPGLI family protein [Moheibacter sp.]|nr:GLPGLI family protein [Moheibacter sp.]